MRRMKLLATALAISLTIAPASAATAPTIAAAVASADRNPDNVKLDESRKPAQVLQFLGLKPGMHVLDLFGANAYWAEIMAPVVGSKGHDTIWEPTQFYSDKTKQGWEAFAAKQPNVWNLPQAGDQVAVLAAGLPAFATAVQRVSPSGTVAAGATAGPELAADPNGPDWLVTQVAGDLAGQTFRKMLTDPAIYAAP